MAWTDHVPPEYLQRLKEEFADTPAVLDLFEKEDGWEDLSSELGDAKPNIDFFDSLELFLAEVDEEGVDATLLTLRRYRRRFELESEWDDEIGNDVENKLDASEDEANET
ncbi:MAG: hypothetical protein WBK28_04085 [Minisyncoccia bacterium]